MSFVEILVSIVLLGTTIIGVLAATRSVIIGTSVERDHAKAHQWLQSSSETVQRIDRIGCDAPNDEDVIRTAYEAAIRGAADNPTGWSDSRIRIVPPIQFWDGEQYRDPPACFDDEGKFLQLIEIEVVSEDGDIIENVEVVKRD